MRGCNRGLWVADDGCEEWPACDVCACDVCACDAFGACVAPGVVAGVCAGESGYGTSSEAVSSSPAEEA